MTFLGAVLSGIVGQHVYEEYLMPDRTDSGRAIDDGARTVSTRAPISRSGTLTLATVTPDAPPASPRSISDVLRPATTRTGSGRALESIPLTGGTSGANAGASANGSGESNVSARRYPGDDALSILADVFSNMFGGYEGQQGEQQYSVIPQVLDSGGGNKNMLLILLVLAAAGFGIYWFYFRKKGGD